MRFSHIIHPFRLLEYSWPFAAKQHINTADDQQARKNISPVEPIEEQPRKEENARRDQQDSKELP
jgi:hypothetical protein